MGNPQFVNCPADTWTKVATAIISGQLWKANTTPVYLQTYKLTGEAVPSSRDEGMKLFSDGDSESISSSEPIDIYVYAVGSAGRVRVDV